MTKGMTKAEGRMTCLALACAVMAAQAGPFVWLGRSLALPIGLARVTPDAR